MSEDAGDHLSGGPSDETSQAAWAKRQAVLAAKLESHRATTTAQGHGTSGTSMRGAADGMRLASEFVAGILVGAGIGYLLDRIAGTGPFGLIVFLILGFVAGVLNVLRTVAKNPSTAASLQKDAAKDENDPVE